MIRVLIVARSLIMQAGLEALMTREPTIQVVGRTAELSTLEQSLRTQQPDVVLLEFALLMDTDLELLTTVHDEAAIALLVTPNESYSAATLLQSGIRAIIPMDVTTDEMIVTVEAIATGLVVLHPEVAEALLKGLAEPDEPEVASDAPLTPREIEVLQLLATGLGNKAIARQLNISEHTVKFHISSIFSKLNATSRTEAVTLGMRQGLIFI
ncbi:LuxR C-terminal-related transcriptional regulator [Leptolyngbya sp. FACHB-16]|uniref:LuxR C-terminal-related transcriptional regulator n=1 Tax=Leptolyngbya sp. PL-A3 TaxID=2933911 RepID=UPI00168A1A4B|nr:response regulator transcription factor [Leptolyngbya sp. FACHB-16]